MFLARSLEFNDTLATLNFTHNPIGEVSKGVRDERLLCVPCCQRTQMAATAINNNRAQGISVTVNVKSTMLVGP